MQRSNETHPTKFTKSLARGQTLVTPVGKDSSDYKGSAAEEIPAKFKMAGGSHDYSKVNPGSK